MKRIGRYLVRGLLGRGGMSRVYLVELPPIGRMAALKRLEPDPLLLRLLGEKALREMFLAEAIKMARLSHPHLAAVQDYDEADGRPFAVMDYHFLNVGVLIGERRRAELPSRILRLDRALAVARETLEGLLCLHHHGIVHLDIKPFNLLLDERGAVRIADFGLSRLRGERVKRPSHLNVGSPWYAAPEQERDPEEADERADLYAFGVTCYRLLTGRLPGPGPVVPSRLNPDLDEGWDEWFRRLLDPDPARRFASAAAAKAALEALEADWRGRTERTCALMTPPPPERPAAAAPPRAAALKVPAAEAAARFGLDELRRPAVYARHGFEPVGAEILRDTANGLLWQRGGSPCPLGWREAHAYVEELNRRGAAGIRSWRLPTVEELLTLLAPTPHGADFCTEAPFDRLQRRLWSCDRRSFTAAWFVDLEAGFVSGLDFRARLFARAVSGGG